MADRVSSFDDSEGDAHAFCRRERDVSGDFRSLWGEASSSPQSTARKCNLWRARSVRRNFDVLPAHPLDDAGAERFCAGLLGGESSGEEANAAITRCLIEKHGFTVVAVEADWP